MSIYTTEERFKELGLKPPNLDFLNRVDPAADFQKENPYNTRCLVHNWYEDRRQYKSLCHRCIGDTIYKTDYLPYCLPPKDDPFPSPVMKNKMYQEGEGNKFLCNTEDYCQYLQNYMTTYDLMHNWEVRRAGVKNKPCRRWKMSIDTLWYPERDNALAFGNLTQFGYRQGPQVPLLPNDWDLYGGNQNLTEMRQSFPPRRYPQDYVHCRKAATKEISRETEEMMQVTKPRDPCDACGECYLYQAGKTRDFPCECLCHYVDTALCKKGRVPTNKERFGTTMPLTMIRETPGKQLLHSPKAVRPYKALKHPEHLPPIPCERGEPSFEPRRRGPGGLETVDGCKDYAGDVFHDYKGPMEGTPICECFMRK